MLKHLARSLMTKACNPSTEEKTQKIVDIGGKIVGSAYVLGLGASLWDMQKKNQQQLEKNASQLSKDDAKPQPEPVRLRWQ